MYQVSVATAERKRGGVAELPARPFTGRRELLGRQKLGQIRRREKR
jgi:hypothetical protein